MGSSGFWQELKRRHVYRVAAAYAIVGWLLIQVVTQVFPVFHLPDWIDQAVVLLILIGFPIALVLAWAFDATPQGIVRTGAMSEVADAGAMPARRSRRAGVAVGLVGVLVALIAGGAYWHFGHGWRLASHAVAASTSTARSPDVAQRNPGKVAPESAANTVTSGLRTVPSTAQAVPIPAKSIAVLPFENLSTDKGNAYFADGMQDLILTKLADIGDLKVISRTSTESYGSHPGNLKVIAQQLGVATILEGSVQKAGKQVLINVQLIDAKTDSHIWAQSYQRTLDNIFGVEGEVADKVANALNAKLTPAETKAVASIPTHNKQAYNAYLKGIYYLYDAQAQARPDEFERSITFLQQAVRHDPGFADAFAALAAAYRHMGGHDDEAEVAVRHALTLDPSSAFAHIQMARLLGWKGKFRQALEQAQTAVRLAPNNMGVINGLGNIYESAGRYDEALAAYKRAIALSSSEDANTPRMNMADVLAMQRRYAAARDTLNYIVVRDPSAIGAVTALANVYEYGWGDLACARTVLQAVSIPVASSGALSDAWYWLDLYKRDYAAALNVIGEAPASWFTSEKYPLGLYQGQVYQAQGEGVRAKAAFAEARKQLKKWIKASPGDADIHAELALALAGLGEGDQARREAQRAVTLQPLAEDTDSGTSQLVSLAAVEARIGDAGAAIKLLDRLLSMPAGLVASVPLLKLDPMWDPIRHDPRFQALLKKYANAAPASAATTAGTASPE